MKKHTFKRVAMGAAAGIASLALVFGLTACSGGETAATDEGSSSSSAADEGAAGYTLVNDGKLTIATSPDFPPFENLENGEYVGFDIEVGKAVAEELGLEPEFVTLQFDAIIPAIQAGGQADIAISGLTVDPERAEQVDFSDSYYTDDQAIAVMKGGSVTADNAEEELNKEGVVIAVQSGTTGETFVKENFPNATVQPYGNSTDAFAAMQAGQANAVCTNISVVSQMLADAYQDAEVVYTAATGEEYAIAVSKDNPELTAAVNEAIAKLEEDGTIDALKEQFGLTA